MTDVRRAQGRPTYLATGGVLWISILGMLHRDHGSGVIFYGGLLIALVIVGTIVGQLLWFRHRRRTLRRELTGD